jgi:hypothetical protein
MIEMMWGKGGSGIKEWQPSCAYFHGFLNKSRDIVDKAALGKVVARRGVERIEGKRVWFTNEPKPEDVDLIIFATGYLSNLPFLAPELDFTTQAYKLVFDPQDPTLCYVGTARPMIGTPATSQPPPRCCRPCCNSNYSHVWPLRVVCRFDPGLGRVAGSLGGEGVHGPGGSALHRCHAHPGTDQREAPPMYVPARTSAC